MQVDELIAIYQPFKATPADYEGRVPTVVEFKSKHLTVFEYSICFRALCSQVISQDFVARRRWEKLISKNYLTTFKSKL